MAIERQLRSCFVKSEKKFEHLQEIRPNLACSKWLDFGGLFKIYQIQINII